MKLILVATDGSSGADKAIDYATDLAQTTGARLLIANIIGGHGLPDELFRRFTQSQTAWLEELLQTHSAEILTAAKKRAAQRGATTAEIESGTGDIARELLDIADKHSVDAIVIGKHGSSGVTTLLLGSVAHKLVSISHRPVIVAP